MVTNLFLRFFITGLLFQITIISYAQSETEFLWPNGAIAAIALTYDDGLPSHIHTVAPMLGKYGFKATFYPTMSSSSLYEEMELWKNLALKGNELGNHTMYHPCQKSLPGMEWVKDYHDLDTYTLPRIEEEIQAANTMLLAIDGEKNRSFAYPCAHYLAGGESYRGIVSAQFVSARDSSSEPNELIALSNIDVYNVPSWAPNEVEGEELIAYIQNIIDNKTFSTLTFHGIGAEYLTVSKEAHEKMLQFLDSNRDKIWVATFKEITAYIQAKRKTTKEN